MVYGFCVLSVMLGFSYASYQQAGRMAGHPEWGFSMALFITFIFTFFTFLFSIAPLLSSARDMPMVMVLPVSSRSVFLSRFFIEWIGCLVMYLFMLAPMFVVGGASFLSVISVVIFIVEGSLFVMSLTFLLSSIGTRLFQGRMHPGTGKVLFSVLIIGHRPIGFPEYDADDGRRSGSPEPCRPPVADDGGLVGVHVSCAFGFPSFRIVFFPCFCWLLVRTSACVCPLPCS
jgi:hypothetical protein